MSAWTVYFISMADRLNAAAQVVIIICGLGVALSFAINYLVYGIDVADKKILSIVSGWCIVLLLIFAPIAIFVPSTGALTAMYIIPKLTQSEQTKQLPEKALKLLDVVIANMTKSDK
jgi:hypothetical protein